MRLLVTSTLSAALCATVLAAQDLRGPDLAVASNFGQGYLPDLMDSALSSGITDFRDAVYWDRVEQPDGSALFDTPQTTYPDVIADSGARLSLTVNNGHPDYDDGATPTSAAAVSAFGANAAATVARFAAIDAVEVGNEFNGPNFVSGPLRDAGLAARADAYAALLASVATQVRATRPDVRIIGGGVHSIPTGYLQMLVGRGAAAHMDSLALHPYSTPVEHYARQIAVMRRIPALASIPVEITEAGTQDAAAAPGTLIRSHCQYGLAGVTRIAWYALNERGDDYAPLITRDGQRTPAWSAYDFARRELQGKPLADVSPDPFTYACLYDGRKLVIWGMPRSLQIIAPGIAAFDASGLPLAGTTFTLSETAPLILIAPDTLSPDRDITLAPQQVLADSYHGFAYPDGADTQAPGGFLRSARAGGTDTPVQTMPGQARDDRPWTPWLGIPDNGDIRLLPQTLLPGGNATFAVSVVHSYTAPETMNVDIAATFAPAERSTDGVEVTLTVAGQQLWSGSGRAPIKLDQTGVPLQKGETLSIAVGPRAVATGDVTDYRITLRRSGPWGQD